jgi:uroporphyrinogen III methyltransferase/synthase
VTAALAVGSYAGIPLTHRTSASAVALVTAHEDEAKASPLDYRALAHFPGTLVFYMSVTSAPRWTAELIAGGLAGDTPAAIVRRCTWPDQSVWRGTLADVTGQIAAARLRPPVVVVVGSAAAHGSDTWFVHRPLHAVRVLVTRPIEQADALMQRLEALGADVLLQPAIAVAEPTDWKVVDAALARISEFDWLVFSSANGVRAVLQRLWQAGRDARALGNVRLAAIGPGTALELERYRLRADLTPGEFRAEELAEALAEHAAVKRFLLARASRGREVLAERLRAAGGHVEQVVVYRSLDVTAADPDVVAQLEGGRVDWVTVTSSAIARSLVHLLGPRLRRARLASLSPVTSATLRELGYEPAAEARTYTLDGLVAAMLEAQRRAPT